MNDEQAVDAPRDEAVKGPADEAPRCSAKACRAVAVTDLHWRNPALHDGTRVKHWLACAAHEQSLADFLDRRGFLLGRSALE